MKCIIVPAKFSDFLSFSIDSRAGLIIPEYSSLEEYDEFVSQAYSALEVEHSVLSDAHEAAGLNDFELKRMHDLGMTLRKMYRYMKSREGNKKAEYVFDYIPIGRWSPKVTFRPVFVGDYTQRHLFSYGERVLMMSATIISKEIFCQEVGINSSEVCYISVPSTFPVENRPIIKRYVGKMNYQSIDKTLPQIAEAIMDIGRKYPDRRGIVQTHSEKIAGYLQQHLDDPRFTFSKQYESPQAALDVHKEKQASILVASGLREGLDLQGELSKIQIFCKVPYPNLGDKLVKRKLEINEVWYGWITVVMFIQALGRSIRSPKEKAVTYILDSGFAYFYKKWGRFIPDYIKEAIKK